jgi:uncharacterized lipoprotein YajG
MNYSKRIALSVIAASLLSLGGCATSLSVQQKAAIRTISIEPVELNPKPMVAGEGMGVAALVAGPLGVLATQGSADVSTTFKTIVEKQVDVSALIRQTAQAELQRKGYKVAEAGQKADARLTIKGGYALGLVSFTGNERAAATTVNVELIETSTGKSIYRKVAMGLDIPASDKAKLRLAPMPQWFADEALVGEQFKLVPRLVTVEALVGL